MICSKSGHLKCLVLVSDKGADLNLATKDSKLNAAHAACIVGQFKCLQLLIKRGASINIKDTNGFTPLDVARVCKQRECVHLLVTNGGVGASMEYLLPLSEATKVMYVYYISAQLIHCFV